MDHEHVLKKDMRTLMLVALELIYRVRGITKEDPGFSDLRPDEDLELLIAGLCKKYGISL